MALSRRELLGGIAVAGTTAATTAAQETPPPGPRVPRPRTPPKPRTSPAVCLYSQHLIKVEFESLGMILRDIGFDGCNLAVIPGGHVPPERANSDLMRAIEAISGPGLELPLLSTSGNSAMDMGARQVMAIAGFMQIPLLRVGAWTYANQDPDARLADVQRELFNFAGVARAYNIAVCLPNLTGDYVGAAVWDYNGILRGVDPRWVGYDFDPGCATQTSGPDGAPNGLRVALARLKAVTVSDSVWSKDSGKWQAAPCPLGEGSVDWPKFFGTLAKAKFNGPLTIEMRYQPKNELSAIRKDLEFVRKQIAASYGPSGG